MVNGLATEPDRKGIVIFGFSVPSLGSLLHRKRDMPDRAPTAGATTPLERQMRVDHFADQVVSRDAEGRVRTVAGVSTLPMMESDSDLEITDEGRLPSPDTGTNPWLA